METDSFYLAMSGDSLNDIAKPDMSQAYEADKKNWLVTDKPSERTPGLFKLEFVDTMGVWLTAKCYLVKNEAGKINIAVKVFQKSIMVCIFSIIKMS